jgi:Peptidase inhibitor family I36
VVVVQRSKLRLVVVVAGALALLGMALPATAGDYNGSCESGEVCLYWGYNYYGGVADFSGKVTNYKGYLFKGPAPGAGHPLNDNAASLRNRGRYMTVHACVDSWGRGDCIRAYPGEAYGDLGPYANRLSSHYWSLD